MFVSLLYVIFSILGISFLIFIHELGHYYMARRVGMRVETFSIGFGRPIYSWMKDGVKWQIGWLLFGGYVKIAGTDIEKEKDPYEVKDGFFGKSPFDRIKVAAMGPLANLAFALLAFALLWSIGGREDTFSDFTSKIGWVDPQSELYAKGIRPGDEITAYGDHEYHSAKDHIYAPMTAGNTVKVKGYKVNYHSFPVEKTPFEYEVNVYQHPAALDKRSTAGILQTANYILYDRLPHGQENPLPEGSPLQNSGIQYGDRIVWVNGETVFSSQQLDSILNSDTVLLTIERDSHTRLARVPRIQVSELRLDPYYREELVDWQYEAGLNQIKLQNLYVIPYNLSNDGTIENALRLIDREKEEEIFPELHSNPVDDSLKPGDQIIAINGIPIQQGYELLKELQTYRANIIVERDPESFKKISWKEADQEFESQLNLEDIDLISNSLGTDQPIYHVNHYYLLAPVEPKTRADFTLSPEKQMIFAEELNEKRKVIEEIEDPERRSQAMRLLEKQENRLLLGLSIQDRKVNYNPGPFTLFNSVLEEMARTFSALISGTLNPKWIVGPIGIVQVVHNTSMSSLKETLYWLGAISMNLGILNLLPIPVLDGGTILMSFIEVITRKRIHPKTLEKLIIPFAVLFICFFVYLTFNDLRRIFGNFFG